LPIRFQGEVWGVLMAYDGEPNVIRDKEVALLEEAAAAISFALDGLERESQRKRAEEERLEMERRLLHAQKLESLGVLAGGIAHDFNNILAGIMGYAELLKRSLPPSEPAQADIDVIKKAVHRAADLTRHMLAYSGKGKFIVEALDLSGLVEEMQKMLEVTVSKKAILKYELAANLPAIEADASQIHQVILNLVVNASEALEEKNGVITVSTDTIELSHDACAAIHGHSQLQAGRHVRLQVADTGCGMDHATRAKIFDPFFTTKFTGRGLGLAAVQGIVRGHKGAIQVFSDLGMGTTFQVYFPALSSAASVAQSESAAVPWRGSGVVLFVDDEEILRSLGKRMLQRAGFSVLIANDGEEAIRLFSEHRKEIACVVLDLTMPKMDGAEVLHELRLISPGVRVILSSGYSEEAAMARFSSQGLIGFLQKPYEFDRMLAALRKAVEAS
jgi:signal transduction histidine kinase